ncbi:MAG: hypothetical protein FWG57_06970 [Endomicrobia bacterium]|nr:hypothetical protein [Endomicrobiia bacterium]
MKVDLTQKEMEYILFLISEPSGDSDGGRESDEYTIDELALMDKLENALRLLEIKELGLGAAVKNKQLN